MVCSVPYIEERFRESNPDIADKLNQEYEIIFDRLIESKLFKNEENTLKLAYTNTKKYVKQLDFIQNINEEYEAEIVTNHNRTISVNVLPLYKTLYNINKPKYYLKDKQSIKTPISIKRLPVQQVVVDINKEILDTINHVLEYLTNNNFNPIIVGGAVRDALIGNKPKDIDIEVYGITVENLEQILSTYGKVDAVGKSFGVLKFIPYDNNGKLVELEEPFDFSVPRRENKVGLGYKGFEIELADDITIEEAATRRDFTWNSIGYNPVTNTLYDYYGGINDLAEGIIRHTSVKFAEDPLRILRAMQFQARMGHVIAPETYTLMKEIVDRGEFDHLASNELYAAFLKEKIRLTAEYKKHVDNNLMLLKQALNNYNKFGILYHGTSNESIVDTIEPPSKTNVIQETTRKKNLDKVFFTKTAKSADIYAGRSLNVNGGTKKVYSVVPIGNVEILNDQAGTEVYMSDKAIIVDDTIDIETQLVHYFNNIVFPQQDEYDEIVSRITKERILGEWEKWSMKGKYHSKVFDFLRKSGLGEKLYPELLTLKDTKQDVVFHPEGDVEEHTKQVIAKAYDIALREKLNVDEKQILILSALLHDIAKPETTKEEWSDKLNRFKITSRGHEQAGEAIVIDLLNRIGIKESVINKIGKIVAEHLAHATISALPTTYIANNSLLSRGIYDKTGLIEHEDDRITFLMYNLSGRIVGRQVYNSKGVKSAKSKDEPLRYIIKGQEGETLIFGMHTYNPNSPYLFVVEGVFDALMLHQEGYPAIAVLTSSTNNDVKNQLRLLNGKKVGILDNDITNTGLKLKKDVDDYYVVPIEKDLNDLYLNNNKEYLSFIKRLDEKYSAAKGMYTPLKVDYKFSKQKKSAFLKLINRLNPANVEELVLLMEADMLGRNNANDNTPISITEFNLLLEEYKENNKGKMDFTPILTGKHLIKAGVKPGVQMGEILAKAKEAQLNLDFTDETESLEWLSNYLSSQNKETIILEDKSKGTNSKEKELKTTISNIRNLLPKSNNDLINTLLEDIKNNTISNVINLYNLSDKYNTKDLYKEDIMSIVYDKMTDSNKDILLGEVKSIYNIVGDDEAKNKLGEILVDKDNESINSRGMLGSVYRGVHNFFNKLEDNKKDILQTINQLNPFDVGLVITDTDIRNSEEFKIFNKNNPYTSEKENLEYFKKCR